MSQLCEYCGAPGYEILSGAEFMSLVEIEALGFPDKPSEFRRAVTCRRHERLVRRRLEERFAPRLIAYREGRPWR